MKINERFEMMDDCMVPILQAKTPADQLEMCFGMWPIARFIVDGGVRYSHPEWSAQERAPEVVRRLANWSRRD